MQFQVSFKYIFKLTFSKLLTESYKNKLNKRSLRRDSEGLELTNQQKNSYESKALGNLHSENRANEFSVNESKPMPDQLLKKALLVDIPIKISDKH
jgi:hypothetical protein